VSRYTPPKDFDHEDERSAISSLQPMRQRRPVVFWVVILGVFAMLLTTIGSFITLLFT
jgi:hypothetical protein